MFRARGGVSHVCGAVRSEFSPSHSVLAGRVGQGSPSRAPNPEIHLWGTALPPCTWRGSVWEVDEL